MRRLARDYPVETRLSAVLALMCLGLGISTDTFLTLANITSLLNNNAVNLIWPWGFSWC